MYIVMLKKQEYRDRVVKTLNFEQQIYKEFEALCKEEQVYPSQKIQQLMIGILKQKKVEAENKFGYDAVASTTNIQDRAIKLYPLWIKEQKGKTGWTEERVINFYSKKIHDPQYSDEINLLVLNKKIMLEQQVETTIK